MELWLQIALAVLILVVGIFIGRIPIRGLYKLLGNAMSALKAEKETTQSLRNRLSNATSDSTHYKNRMNLANANLAKAQASAEVLHKGCKNGDEWSDHTEEFPSGLTPARRKVLEEKRIREEEAERRAEAKRQAERKVREEKERKEREAREAARKKSQRSSSGYTDGGAGFIAVAASVDTSFSSCDSGGGGGDCG